MSYKNLIDFSNYIYNFQKNKAASDNFIYSVAVYAYLRTQLKKTPKSALIDIRRRAKEVVNDGRTYRYLNRNLNRIKRGDVDLENFDDFSYDFRPFIEILKPKDRKKIREDLNMKRFNLTELFEGLMNKFKLSPTMTDIRKLENKVLNYLDSSIKGGIRLETGRPMGRPMGKRGRPRKTRGKTRRKTLEKLNRYFYVDNEFDVGITDEKKKYTLEEAKRYFMKEGLIGGNEDSILITGKLRGNKVGIREYYPVKRGNKIYLRKKKNAPDEYIYEYSNQYGRNYGKRGRPKGKTKGKIKNRKPSKYNLFVKKRMAELRRENPNAKPKDLIPIIAKEWKNQKQ